MSFLDAAFHLFLVSSHNTFASFASSLLITASVQPASLHIRPSLLALTDAAAAFPSIRLAHLRRAPTIHLRRVLHCLPPRRVPSPTYIRTCPFLIGRSHVSHEASLYRQASLYRLQYCEYACAYRAYLPSHCWVTTSLLREARAYACDIHSAHSKESQKYCLMATYALDRSSIHSLLLA